MKEYPTKRLMQYAAYKGISISAFEKSIGKAPSYLRNSKDITSAVMDTLKKKYPDLSIDWLITGKGSMINNIVRLNIDKEKVRDMQNVPDYIEIPEQAKDIIERVLQGTSKDSDNPVMVAEPSTEYGENEISQVKVETRPRIPLTAAAGSLSNAAKGVTLKDCEQMPIVKQFPSYDFTMFVKGDSMSPKYESGDEIACRWIDQSRFIQWGKIHVLDTSQGIVVKKVYEDGEKIRCVSINTDYPAFSIPKEDIYSMALVIGALNISEM